MEFNIGLDQVFNKLNTQLSKENEAPKDTLRPINPDNAWSLRITAAAGT
jgi:hypothetical protein